MTNWQGATCPDCEHLMALHESAEGMTCTEVDCKCGEDENED